VEEVEEKKKKKKKKKKMVTSMLTMELLWSGMHFYGLLCTPYQRRLSSVPVKRQRVEGDQHQTLDKGPDRRRKETARPRRRLSIAQDKEPGGGK
jgi:hypothetical protein